MLLNKSYQKAPASLILIQPIKKPREVTAATMTNLTVLLQYADINERPWPWQRMLVHLLPDGGRSVLTVTVRITHPASTGGLWSAVQSLQSCGEDKLLPGTHTIRLGSCITFYDEPWTMDLTAQFPWYSHIGFSKCLDFNVANKTHLVWQIPWDNSPGPGLVTSEQI